MSDEFDARRLAARAMAPVCRPARTRWEHYCNHNLLQVGCAHLITGLSISRATTWSAPLADEYPETETRLARDASQIYHWNDTRQTLAQTIDGYERHLALLSDGSATLLPAGATQPWFDVQRLRRPSVTPPLFASPTFAVDGELGRATELAFAPAALTAALLVVVGGELLVERYGCEASPTTPLAAWSMGKSIVALMIGALIEDGLIDLDAPAPIEEWRMMDGDPRRNISIADLLRMSGGLRFSGYQEPAYAWGRACADHMLPYFESIDSYVLAAHAPPQHEPGTTGRYRNCDIALCALAAKRIIEAQGLNFDDWIRQRLLTPAGADALILCRDAFGNPIFTGANYGPARSWAALGQLCLARGTTGGRRLAPEAFFDFLRAPAPAWRAMDRPETESRSSGRIYGAGFWTNHAVDGAHYLALPDDAYFMLGGGCQVVVVVPSLDAVIVRLGHYRGKGVEAALNAALAAMQPLLERRSRGRLSG